MMLIIVDALATLSVAVVIRWLFGIGNFEQDMSWLKRKLHKIELYRGTEYIHQLRAKRLLG